MPRVGTAYNILLAKQHMEKNRLAHTKALEPLATGRVINRPSDEPSRIAEYFRQMGEVTRIEQFDLNVSTARTRVNVTDSTLSSIGELLNEVYELALQGNDQTLTPEELSYLTSRLTDLKADITDLANTKLGNIYVFSGYKSSTQPFTGTPTVFNGDSNTINVKVTSTKQVRVSIDGDETFMGGGGGVDIFDTIDDLVTSIQARDEVAVGSLITDVLQAQDQINTARATMANSTKGLDTAENTLAELNVQISERVSVLSDVDVATATADLGFKEFTLKSSLAVARRVMEVQLQSFFE